MNKLSTWLFNPFHYIAGGTTLTIGIALIIVTAIWAPFLGITFDGILHIGFGNNSFVSELMSELIIINVMIVLLWLAGATLSKTEFRLLDLVGTQMVARWPFLFIGLVGFSIPTVNDAMHEFSTMTPEGMQLSFSGDHMPVVATFNLVALLFTIWSVVLMYKSFSISCNVNGGKSIGVFCFLLVIGYILSLMIISLFS